MNLDQLLDPSLWGKIILTGLGFIVVLIGLFLFFWKVIPFLFELEDSMRERR